ncbi:hypothetical protein MXB_716 [Myxobolus squamalis]|nr:hypothetical protein MXB_716 [Myxobolus squamalis]
MVDLSEHLLPSHFINILKKTCIFHHQGTPEEKLMKFDEITKRIYILSAYNIQNFSSIRVKKQLISLIRKHGLFKYILMFGFIDHIKNEFGVQEYDVMFKKKRYKLKLIFRSMWSNIAFNCNLSVIIIADHVPHRACADQRFLSNFDSFQQLYDNNIVVVTKH